MSLTLSNDDIDALAALIVAHVWALEGEARAARITGRQLRPPEATEQEVRNWRERMNRFRDAITVGSS